MLSARRLTGGFTVLLLLYGTAAPAVAACGGWSSSSGDRHACCARLGELASDGSITDCCAMSEQSSGPADRDHQLPFPAHSASVLTGSAWLVHDTDTLRGPFVVDSTPTHAASPPKYVLLSSFLI